MEYKTEIENNTDSSYRRLRPAEFFLDKENEEEYIEANKSDYMPFKGRSHNLDKIIRIVGKNCCRET